MGATDSAKRVESRDPSRISDTARLRSSFSATKAAFLSTNAWNSGSWHRTRETAAHCSELCFEDLMYGVSAFVNTSDTVLVISETALTTSWSYMFGCCEGSCASITDHRALRLIRFIKH